MDSPYDEPWGLGGPLHAAGDAGNGGSAGGGGGDPSAGEATSVAAVILVEIVVIAGLLFYLVSVACCVMLWNGVLGRGARAVKRTRWRACGHPRSPCDQPVLLLACRSNF
eukprot:COSAG02_NODE_83_length_39665_cov_25.213719_8_plen_110_part_00